MKRFRYCPVCKAMLVKIKEDDNHRLACKRCGWRHYYNPLPSVAIFVIDNDNRILLIKRGIEPGMSKWALPSGFIERDELPEETALRELKEETGITGKTARFLGIFIEPTKVYGNILLIGYRVDPAGGRLKPGSDSIAVKFHPRDRLPRIPFPSHRAIISMGLQQGEQTGLLREILKSKITEAVITKTVLFYKGSMGIDSRIMEAANIVPGEKVHVLNYDNSERLETYVIPEKPGSRQFILYGPASLKGKAGQRLCILSFGLVSDQAARRHRPRIIILDSNNHIKQIKS